MRDSFVFYRSFYEAMSGLSDEEKGRCFDVLANYAINGVEPEGLEPIERLFFTLAKPQIDKNNQKYENGLKGGRSKNQTETKNKPNENQIETKPKANDNDNVNVNDNKKEIKKKDSADAPNKQYAFEGKIIKLKQKDFDAWKLAYPDLNLRGELLQRDIWLQEQPEAEQKKWFISTSQFFIKQNERRKAQNTCIAGQYTANEKPETENECWF